MAKTLIIKGANFSENKLDTVAFDSVPCTGITLDSDSMPFTSYGQEINIGYTLTPSNTTDVPSVVSNNENIVIIDDGKAKAIGVGTTTITITCGEQTATISVSSEMKMTNKVFKSGYYLTMPSPDYARESSANEKFGYCGTSEEWGDQRIAASSSEPYVKVHRIPKNTASITVDVPDSTHKAVIAFFNSTQNGNPVVPLVALCLQCPMPSDVDYGDRTVNVPSGADSFCITYRHPSAFNENTYKDLDVIFNAVSQ